MWIGLFLEESCYYCKYCWTTNWEYQGNVLIYLIIFEMYTCILILNISIYLSIFIKTAIKLWFLIISPSCSFISTSIEQIKSKWINCWAKCYCKIFIWFEIRFFLNAWFNRFRRSSSWSMAWICMAWIRSCMWCLLITSKNWRT